MVSEGEKAPDFTLDVSSGGQKSLSDFQGKYIVLYFYPKDDTPGCTKEACSFRDDFEDYKNKNAVILGVSKDNIVSHQKFIDKYKLPFLLLSDPDGKVCEMYGVWKEKKNFGKVYMVIERTTFIISPEGIIKKIFNKVKVDGHSEAIIKEISN